MKSLKSVCVSHGQQILVWARLFQVLHRYMYLVASAKQCDCS